MEFFRNLQQRACGIPLQHEVTARAGDAKQTWFFYDANVRFWRKATCALHMSAFRGKADTPLRPTPLLAAL
jgi:hypothetical protein